MKNWTLEELQTIYNQPLLQLIAQAQTVHSQHHHPNEVQVCTLISVKTGGCTEDCKYCAQSSRYQTDIKPQPMMKLDEVMRRAKIAKAQGTTRICLGMAWREVRNNALFEELLCMVKEITALGLEVCCTLGMLDESQAQRLKEAGIYAYNHNLDSSENFYKTIITTRTYQERLHTLDIVEKTGIHVCCGCIIGMGETVEDRLQFLLTLSRRPSPPHSIPINRLLTVPGTPLEKQSPTAIWEMIRMVATTRIIFPKAMVRLSAGRMSMSYEQQALCFLAGVNSIHVGEKLLTLPNNPMDQDQEMFQLLGLQIRQHDAEQV